MDELSIAVNHDIAKNDLTPFSDYFGFEPFCTRIGYGISETRMLSQRLVLDGVKTVTITIPGVEYTKLKAYRDAIFGNPPNKTSERVTLLWLDETNTYVRVNAYADIPRAGASFSFVNTDEIRDLILEFRVTAVSS